MIFKLKELPGYTGNVTHLNDNCLWYGEHSTSKSFGTVYVIGFS
jgi:hypothetical protein